MAERVTEERTKRERGYLYYIGKDGFLWKMPTKLNRFGKQARIGTEKIKREEGFIYFLDKKGYVCKARIRDPDAANRRE